MPTVTEIFTKAKDHLRAIVGEAMAINVKENKKVLEKLDELKPIEPKEPKDYTNDLKAIETAVKEQEVAENVTINNPEAITGDLKTGLEDIIITLKEEVRNFEKQVTVKNDLGQLATLFKSTKDKKAVVDALGKVEKAVKSIEMPSMPEIKDTSELLMKLIETIEKRESLTSILEEIRDKEFFLPPVLDVNLDPSLIDNDRVRTILPESQVKKMSKMIVDSNNSQSVVDAVAGGSLWLQQLGLDKDDATNYYFGFKVIGKEEWRIKRINKTTFAVDWATGESDSGTAWTNRTSQSYGNL